MAAPAPDESSAVLEIELLLPQASSRGGALAHSQQLLTAAREHVRRTLVSYDGEVWLETERLIFTFSTLRRAVEGGISLLETMTALEAEDPRELIFVRAGLTVEREYWLAAVPEENRATYTSDTLLHAQSLCDRCPAGFLAISAQAYASMGTRRRMFRPAAAPGLRHLGAFVSHERQATKQSTKLTQGLTNQQRNAIAPIVAATWSMLAPGDDFSFKDLSSALGVPTLVVLGESNGESNTDRGEESPVGSAATSDAVGITEIFAASNGNDDVVVSIDQWEDTADLASDRTVIVVGSGLVNTYAFAINDLCAPLRFYKHAGELYDRIQAKGTSVSGESVSKTFGQHKSFGPHCGLVMLCRSPFNPSQKLLWISGVSGMGTQAATRFVHELIRQPDGVWGRIELPEGFKPTGVVVGARSSQPNLKLTDYYGRWRIADYEILWVLDGGNHVFDPENPESQFLDY